MVVGSRGALAGQVERLERPAVPILRSRQPSDEPMARLSERPGDGKRASTNLLFANSRGGFSRDGREYVIQVAETATTGSQPGIPSPRHPFVPSQPLPPAPWINVVSNPSFGFLVSESGSGYTWAGNSQTNRLTPWNNDPVSDAPGEVIYLRDEASDEVWSPTPLPLGIPAAFVVRHGQGYSVFEHTSRGLGHELTLFAPPDDPVKLTCLKLINVGRETRRLVITFYAEWVLGTVRDQAPMNVVTEIEPASGALLARNAFNTDFGSRVAFADVNLRPRTYTADRTEFLGRNGSVHAPAAIQGAALSGAVGAGLDPCAAIQTRLLLRPGEEKEIVFFLGQAGSHEEVQQLLERYRTASSSSSRERPRADGKVKAALAEARECWERVLSAVQVRTPNPALDLLVNRWLPYQVLGCRFWGRSAFYQSGGAYGFRDQLLDAMALVHGAPQEVRAHLLRAASRQFPEGDVQHWWHPPAGGGVRTRFSDDFLWLPYAVSHYVVTTGDFDVLKERIPFLRAPLLKQDQEEDYRVPDVSEEGASLYEHCVRAIENGLRFGRHGLPLMGSGDWNDGMNRVGHGGQGESVWNSWFLLSILPSFSNLALGFGDSERAERYRAQAERLHRVIEEHAWDGRWYKRAWFDDGTPLGSAANDECRIDSLAQSWAVISGAADPNRARSAMQAVEEFLIRDKDKVILLFTPPFDKGRLEPGYIKGYVPGIRENGGQYTHAAIWVVQAIALLGQHDRAMELFDLLNPIHHASSPQDVERYRVEPYVVAADIYGEPPHTGRGGWTWYTGSAGWLYRLALETLLGLQVRGNKLTLQPHIPGSWHNYEIIYRYRSAMYHIHVENLTGVEPGIQRARLDGRDLKESVIELADDGKRHEVQVVIG
jgi:cellobiose phosphorylase